MGSRNNLYCWEIMQCKNPDACLAKEKPEKKCWEIVSESDDYRMANNICRDCIVYVLKADDSILSQQEIQKVMKKKPKRPVINWCMDIESLQQERY